MSDYYTIETIDGSEHGHPGKRVRIVPDDTGNDSPLAWNPNAVRFFVNASSRSGIPEGAESVTQSDYGFILGDEGDDGEYGIPESPDGWKQATLDAYGLDENSDELAYPVRFVAGELSVLSWQDVTDDPNMRGGDYGPDGVVIVNLADTGCDETNAKDTADADAQTYNQWARGEVYGYIVEKLACEKCGTWDSVESCWGFYDEAEAVREGIDILEAIHVR